MLFQLGQVVATANATQNLDNLEIVDLIRKHATGDFGVLDNHDINMNKRAIKNGDDRVFSAYMVRGNKVYVITEWDRSITTVLMAEDY